MHVHPDSFMNVLMRPRTLNTNTLTWTAPSHFSCRQTAAGAINVSQHCISVSLSQVVFFSRAHCQGGKVWEGLGQYTPPHSTPISRASVLRCSPDSITCVRFSWINNGHFGGLAGTWWPHADGSLMSSTGTVLPWHRWVSQSTRPCPWPSPLRRSVWALIT